MPSPVNDLYVRSGSGDVAGGRTLLSPGLAPLLNQIAAAPENSWIKVNTNSFQSVWPASDFRPPYPSETSASPGHPSAVMRAWSSFGWDDRQCRLVLWGGGHANYNGNEVYLWDGASRQWSLAFYPSMVKDAYNWPASQQTIDGTLNSPQSSHTFGGNQYLPILDRFITFGGAASPSGGALVIQDDTGHNLRLAGAYTLDLALAGQGHVGGLTGSNPKRGTSAGVNLPGAQAWSVRDYYLDHPNTAVVSRLKSHTSFITAYRQENGHDVLYVQTGPAGSAPDLLRIEFVDHDYRNDILSVAGYGFTADPYWQGGDLDSVRNVFMQLNGRNGNLMEGWNLNIVGNTIQVPMSAANGPAAATVTGLVNLSSQMAMCFDEKRNRFVVWGRGGDLYSLHTPDNLGELASNWYCDTIVANPSPRPKTEAELGVYGDGTENDSGAMGKWKRSKLLDVYVALQGSLSGDVWMFKPSGWTDPR